MVSRGGQKNFRELLVVSFAKASCVFMHFQALRPSSEKSIATSCANKTFGQSKFTSAINNRKIKNSFRGTQREAGRTSELKPAGPRANNAREETSETRATFARPGALWQSRESSSQEKLAVKENWQSRETVSRDGFAANRKAQPSASEALAEHCDFQAANHG